MISAACILKQWRIKLSGVYNAVAPLPVTNKKIILKNCRKIQE